MARDRFEEANDVSKAVIGAAIEVHRELGPGLLENLYQEALLLELRERNLDVETEVDLPIQYKGQPLDGRYRIDLLVDDVLVAETKAVEELASVHERQLLTYLELAGLRLGLLINFQQAKLVDGIRRLIR